MFLDTLLSSKEVDLKLVNSFFTSTDVIIPCCSLFSINHVHVCLEIELDILMNILQERVAAPF